MNLFKVFVLIVVVIIFCLMISLVFVVEEIMLQNMICQEFMDMNLKSMILVVFWVVNCNIDFSGGDYVDWYEVEIVLVLKMLQECYKNFVVKFGDFSVVIKK